MTLKLDSWIYPNDLIELKNDQYMVMIINYDSQEELSKQLVPDIKICSSFNTLIEAFNEFEGYNIKSDDFSDFKDYKENDSRFFIKYDNRFYTKYDNSYKDGRVVYVYDLNEREFNILIKEIVKRYGDVEN